MPFGRRGRALRAGAGPTSLVLLALGGCGHAQQAQPSKVAILPLDAVGLPVEAVGRVRRAIGQQVSKSPGLIELPLARVDETARAASGCQPLSRERLVPCAVLVGSALNATQAVVGAVGGLGSTYVLQLHLVGVKSRTVIRSLEETLFGTPDRLEAALGNITARLFDLQRAPRWYERWWVWTLVGVAVSAAVVVPIVVLRERDPYQNIPLP